MNENDIIFYKWVFGVGATASTLNKIMNDMVKFENDEVVDKEEIKKIRYRIADAIRGLHI